MKEKEIKVSYIVSRGKRFQCKSRTYIRPKILISGNWLNSIGFEIGETIKVSVKENQIILTTKTS